MKRTLALCALLLWTAGFGIGCSEDAPPAPVLSGIQPSSGPAGGSTEVTLSGQSFQMGMEVSIGGKPVPVKSLSPDGKGLVFVTPGGPAGPQEVTVRVGEDGEPSAPLTFTYEALGLRGIFPGESEVTVAFTQPIQSDGATLELVGAEGESRYDDASYSLIFVADGPLEAGRDHEIRIRGVRDLAGNALPDQTASFSMAEGEAASAPSPVTRSAPSTRSAPAARSASAPRQTAPAQTEKRAAPEPVSRPQKAPGSAPGRTYDDDRLETSYFGRDLPFVEADKVDYLWVKDGFKIEGNTFHFLPWSEPQFLGRIGAKRDEKDRFLAESMNSNIHKAFADTLGRVWTGASTSTSKGNIKVRGRIVDCSTGNTAAKVVVGFGAGSGKTTFDLKFTDAATGELVMAIHHRVVSGTVWSTTDSKFVKWIEKFGKVSQKKGLGTLYQKGDERKQ